MKKDKKKNNMLIGTFILIYFFSTIIGIVYFAKSNQLIMGILFGQLFFTFGMLTLFSKEIMDLIFVLVGAAIMSVSSYFLWGTHLNIDTELVFKILFASAFILVPLICFLSDYITKKKALAVCTYKVIGKCIDYETSYNGTQSYMHQYMNLNLMVKSI